MTSSLYYISKDLEKCVEYLEEDVKRSFDQLNVNSHDNNAVALEASKDYHYRQILKQLQQIKGCIEIIRTHDQSLQSLQTKINNGNKIDKNYIKKQVETFQKIGNVNRREQKPFRPRPNTSMKFLECWEKLVESDGLNKEVPKREHCLRKSKKVVSSTVDTFLESVEAINEEIKVDKSVIEEETEVVADTTPRIVEVIYKKKPNV